MQRLKLRIEESGEKLSAAYAPPKWSETAEKRIDEIEESLVDQAISTSFLINGMFLASVV